MQDISSIQKLEQEVRYHNDLYFKKHAPVISDYEFDQLVERLKKLKPNSQVLKEIGSDLVATSQKIEHSSPMLSLDKCYQLEDLLSWMNKFEGQVVAAPKIDGLAIAIRYDEKGNLSLAETRGDGWKGDEITQNVKAVKSIPHRLSQGSLEIRGEVYLPLSVFRKKYQDQFANPRNLAAGALKQKDPEKTAEYGLQFFAYEVLGEAYQDEMERIKKLESLKFKPVETKLLPRESEALQKVYEAFLSRREQLDFEIDGVVYKTNQLSEQTRLGASGHHPRWAMAYKFQGDSSTSILRDVEWSVSRTGAITPIGLVDPVVLSGATVSRVSLHNLGLMQKQGVTLGAKVLMMRRGGVIPKLEAVLKKTKKQVKVPKRCPSCNFSTEVRDEFLHCTNPQGCRKTKLGELKHFVDVLEIDGFGGKLIERLYDAGFVEEVDDFFRLSVDDLLSLERVGEILAKKLINNIQIRRRVPLSLFLRALGISELGKHISTLLAKQYRNLDAIFQVKPSELVALHTVGEIIAEKVIQGLNEKKKLIKRLLKFVQLQEKESAKKGALSGKSFLFTGKLKTMPRGQAEKKVEAEGGEISSGVSKDLDYLVIGSEGYRDRKKGNKWLKAEVLKQKGAEIEIISEEEFFSLLEK